MIIYFWLVVFFLSQILSGMPGQMLNSAWPTMYKFINASETNLGILQGTFLFITTLSLMFSAILKKKIGARNLCGVGIFLLGIGLFLYSISTKFYICVIASGLIGLSCGFVDMISNFYLTMYYSPTLLTWMNCCWGLGSSLGAFIISVVLSKGFDYKFAYRLVIPIYIILSILIIVIRYFDDKKRKEKSASEINVSETKVVVREKEKSDINIYIDLFKKKNIILYFMCLFSANFMLYVICVWLPIYSVNIRGINPVVAASFESVLFGTLAIFRFFSGVIVKFIDAKSVISFGLIFYFIASIILFFAGDNIYLYYVSVGIIGLGLSPQYPLLISLSKVFFGERNLDAVIGTGTSFAQIGGFVGTTLTGFLANIFGFNSFLFMSVFSGLFAIFLFALLRKKASI